MASHLFSLVFQAMNAGGMRVREYRRNAFFFVLFPFMLLYVVVNIPILLLFSLGDLQEGEYYWQDIIGLDVYGEDDCHLGWVETIFPTGSNDVYVCRGGGKEILIPAIADVIIRINLEERKMIIRLLEGLQT